MNDRFRDPQPSLNLEAAMKLCSGDGELFRDLATLFLQDSTDRAEKLEKALDSGDMGEARRLAHAVKGLCANICAEPLKDVAHRLEKAADKKAVDELEPLRGEFDREFARLKETLVQIIPPKT